MGHSFDTGLAKPQRTLVRETLIARLTNDTKLKRYVQAVKPLPRVLRGEGDGDGLAMLQAALGAKAPAILVGLGSKRRTKSTADPLETIGDLEVVVYVASAHARDLVDGRLGGDGVSAANLEADPGLEIILDHVEECIDGQLLGITGTKELKQTEEDEVATFAEFTVWQQRYTVEVERVIDPNRDETILVTSIEGRHQESGIPEGLPDGATDLDPLVTLANLLPETP